MHAEGIHTCPLMSHLCTVKMISLIYQVCKIQHISSVLQVPIATLVSIVHRNHFPVTKSSTTPIKPVKLNINIFFNDIYFLKNVIIIFLKELNTTWNALQTAVSVVTQNQTKK